MHDNQLSQLQRLWGQYFARLRKRERQILKQFQTEERQNAIQERETLQRRCHSLKVNRSASFDLQQKERYYLRVGDYRSLRLLKPQVA